MPKGIRKIHFSFGEKNITRFGGMFLIHKFCQKVKLKWYLQKYVQFHQYHESYQVSELILIILYSIIVGILRIDTTRPLQYNGVFQKLMGIKKYPDPTAIRRFLHRLSPKAIRQIVKVHNLLQQKLFFIQCPKTGVIFDIDPTVVTVYGKQQRARVGFNPKKRGRRCYNIFLCFESNHQEFWLGSLQSGNIQPVILALSFLKACIDKLPKSVRRVRIRADSHFFSGKFIEPLDEGGIGYSVESMITNPIRTRLQTIKYSPYKKDWEVGEFYHQPQGHSYRHWKKMYRFVVERRPLPKDSEEKAQLKLFEMQGYGYRVVITNLPLKPRHVWNFHNQRARGAELNIKELKYNYPLSKIPTQSYTANIAYLQLLMFAFNIVNWFKRLCLTGKFRYSTLQKIRQNLLVIPARLVRSEQKNILQLPSGYPYQKLFNQLITKIEHMEEFQKFVKKQK